MEKNIIHSGKVGKPLLLISMVMALVYFSWWFTVGHIGNVFLYSLLFFGETYHVLVAFLFWMTIWPATKNGFLGSRAGSAKFYPRVDIFIPVAGEPVDVVGETIRAAKAIKYPNFNIYVLNDSYVAKKYNWKDIENLAHKAGVECITRKKGGGAKAGNLNNALKQTYGEIVVILDSDMVAHPDFLEKVIPYFRDSKMAFVQTPQFYKNHNLNEVAGGAWEQQELFFGAIMKGKNNWNSAFICGTNVAIRRKALVQVGGMREDNIAEDFLTSLEIHQKGWRSYYLDEVLVEGLAPEDVLSYYKQQFRWARGSLEVLFGDNPLFKRGLKLSQKLQYLSSSLYYFNGVVILIDMLIPLMYLFFGVKAVLTSSTSFSLFFIPYMFFILITLYFVSARSFTFRAISFSQSSWILQLSALKALLLGEKSSFSVTSKKALRGDFLFLAYPHLLYIILLVFASFLAIGREGLNPSITANIAWGIFNVALFLPFIKVTYNWENLFRRAQELTSSIRNILL